MMCQMIGRPPISTIGFGLISVSSRNRVPRPPHRMTTSRVGDRRRFLPLATRVARFGNAYHDWLLLDRGHFFGNSSGLRSLHHAGSHVLTSAHSIGK